MAGGGRGVGWGKGGGAGAGGRRRRGTGARNRLETPGGSGATVIFQPASGGDGLRRRERSGYVGTGGKVRRHFRRGEGCRGRVSRRERRRWRLSADPSSRRCADRCG